MDVAGPQEVGFREAIAVRDVGVGGSNPLTSTRSFFVRTEVIGNIVHLRHRLQPRAERIVDGLQSPLLKPGA
jgi:hypothetical protein